METIQPTIYERQKRAFLEFLDEVQDRFDLIIHDNVQIIFDESSLTFDNKVLIRYSIKTVTPEVLFLDSLKTKQDFELAKAILDNYTEICSWLKRYVTIFNHLSELTDKGLSSDDIYVAACKNIDEMINENDINGQKFFIKTQGENNDIQVYLEVENYGSSHKLTVDLCYLIIMPDGTENKISHYSIEKDKFISDVASQLSNRYCTHLK